MENNIIQQPMLNLYNDLQQIVIAENAVAISPRLMSRITGRCDKTDLRPLLFSCPPIVNTDPFINATLQVAEILKKYFPQQSEEIDLIISVLPKEQADRNELVSKIFIPGTNLATCFSTDLPAETLGLLFSNTAKPFIKKYVEMVLPEIDPDRWYKGFCPICGARPNLAILDYNPNGKYLHCGVCEIKWRFYRLKCPFCNDSNSQYFSIKGAKKYRVYICDKCGGYIKTIIRSESNEQELNFFMEDISTIQLDLLALKEGYRK